MPNTLVTEPKPAPSPTFTELNVRQDKGKPHFIRLHDSVVKALEQHLKTAGGDASGILLGSVAGGEHCTIAVEEFEPASKIEEAVRSKSPRRVVGYYRSYSRAEFTLESADRALFQRCFPKDARLLLLVQPAKTGVGTAMFFLGENGQLTTDRATVEFPFNLRELGAEEPAETPAPAPVVVPPPPITKPIAATPVVVANPVSAPKPAPAAPPTATKPTAIKPVAAAPPAAAKPAAPPAAPKPAAAKPVSAPPVVAAPLVAAKPASAPPVVAAPPAAAKPVSAPPVVAAKPVTVAPATASQSASGGSSWMIAVAGAAVFAGLGLYGLGVFNRQPASSVVVEGSTPENREAQPEPTAVNEPKETPKAPPKTSVAASVPASSPAKPVPVAVAPPVAQPIEIRRTPPTPIETPVAQTTPPPQPQQPTAQTPVVESRPAVTTPPPVRTQSSEPAPAATTRPAPVAPPAPSPKSAEPARPYVAPRAIRQAAPAVTSDMRRSLEGDLVVRVLVSVNAAGNVTSVQSAPGGTPVPEAVTKATFDAVKRFQFEPARRGDEKVAGDIELSFTFRK